MGLEEQRIAQISEKAPGRCPTCIHSLAYDMPDKTRYWCRAFATQIPEAKRKNIRDCPRWRAFSPHPDRSRKLNDDDPMLQEILAVEDFLFFKSKILLEQHGLCLKTMVSIAHPTAHAPRGDLDWIDHLDGRFPEIPRPILVEVLAELRALSYFSLALMIETAVGKDA